MFCAFSRRSSSLKMMKATYFLRLRLWGAFLRNGTCISLQITGSWHTSRNQHFRSKTQTIYKYSYYGYISLYTHTFGLLTYSTLVFYILLVLNFFHFQNILRVFPVDSLCYLLCPLPPMLSPQMITLPAPSSRSDFSPMSTLQKYRSWPSH